MKHSWIPSVCIAIMAFSVASSSFAAEPASRKGAQLFVQGNTGIFIKPSSPQVSEGIELVSVDRPLREGSTIGLTVPVVNKLSVSLGVDYVFNRSGHLDRSVHGLNRIVSKTNMLAMPLRVNYDFLELRGGKLMMSAYAGTSLERLLLHWRGVYRYGTGDNLEKTDKADEVWCSPRCSMLAGLEVGYNISDPIMIYAALGLKYGYVGHSGASFVENLSIGLKFNL